MPEKATTPMGFNYDPEDASSAWPEGEYDASLEAVTDGVSKSSGDQMQTWALRVYHSDGRDMMVKDYIVRATVFKIASLAKAIGKESEFKAKRFQAGDNIGASVRVKLKIDEGKDGYPDKNKIVSYLPYRTAEKPAPARTAAPVPAASKDEDAPF